MYRRYYDSEGYAIPTRRASKKTPASSTASDRRLILIAKNKYRANNGNTIHYLKQAGASFFLGNNDSKKKVNYSFAEERGKPRKREARKKKTNSILDTPYIYISRKGSSKIEELAEKSLEYKAKGSHAKGLAYAIGASALSAGVGAAVAITGLFSPRAWKDTYTMLRHPKQTAKTIAKNPLDWSMLAGSLILPTKIFKFAGDRLTAIREPDMISGARNIRGSGKLIIDSDKRWSVEVEQEGISRSIGRGELKTPNKRYFTVGAEDKTILVSEIRSNKLRPTVKRDYVIFEEDKVTYARETYRFNWRGTRYKYKLKVYDPEKTVLLERERPRLFDTRILENPPLVKSSAPSILASIGGAILGASIGAGAIMHSRHGSRQKPATSGLTTPLTGSRHSRVMRANVTKSGGRSLFASGAFAPSRQLAMFDSNTKYVKSGKHKRKRAYAEIVYPELKLVF